MQILYLMRFQVILYAALVVVAQLSSELSGIGVS
jgi:hypothetical protein